MAGRIIKIVTGDGARGATIPNMQPVQESKPKDLGAPIPDIQHISQGQSTQSDGQGGSDSSDG